MYPFNCSLDKAPILTWGSPFIGTIHLTRAEFLKKIADYENHSKEWKYLGDKPAISTSTPTGAVVDLFSDVPLQDAKANSPMNRKGIRMLFFIFLLFNGY